MATSASSRRRWAALIGSLAATALGVGLVAALPRLVGISWAAIGSSVAGIPALVLVGLVVLWFAGLLVHAPVLMAAMPGLTVRQALSLNLAGSAVSNVVPIGGPAGMGLGYAMARSWGFSAERFASFTVATNAWNVFGKFVMSCSVLGTAAVLGTGLPSGLVPIVISAAVFMTIGVGAAVATFRTVRATVAVGRTLDSIVTRIRPARTGLNCSDWLLGSRSELVAAVRVGWKPMSLGVGIYLVLQAALLFACLGAVGAGATITVVVIAFAIERLISLAPITPGASGVAELGTVAALTALGVDPVSAAAGVMIYRTLMFAIEIPVGGLIALNWLRTRTRNAAPATVSSVDVAAARADAVVTAGGAAA